MKKVALIISSLLIAICAAPASADKWVKAVRRIRR